MSFKDHFSAQAAIYREARPQYPDALFEFLRAQAPGGERAWDAGCGNGQASVALARHFHAVVATDPSAEQIAHAQRCANVDYRVEAAERSTLAAASIDLVCVAQALHWLDLERFHAEVRRVLRPRGVVAFWSYADCRVSDAVDRHKDRLYADLTGPYWPPERALVENGYASLPFPFERIPVPAFELQMEWTVDRFLAYLRSWSASQAYLRERDEDPVGLIEVPLREAWGAADRVRTVRWDFHLHCGRV
ncbi:MAG: class I SAM-dependent methyltransferase [Dokdonella sp.]|nr:class I SAM-dependent methyltransferase [Dokdonella sp.]MCB1569515.1 class I SAM-dependent methyltransferase [Xanthomonadales bacterium]MCB1572434.1 class I SAM-dependent methyltransferase [Xanthomonadales bacterium]MCB1576562.1 class I SAM-dependent methyltransferase [Xanthomonadales bacterium]